jgi:hypothetical protein
MTPRAKLAKRITAKKPEPIDYNYEIVNLSDVHLRVVDKFYADSKQEADKTFDKWLEMKGLPNDTHNYGYRPRKQEAVKEPAVQDIAPDVAQNFNQPADATSRVGSWSIYDVTLGREISRMDNVAWSQADARANELERSTGHNISVRGLSEAVDAVSGAGAVARAIAGAKPPSPVPVRRKDPAVKLDIKNKSLDPYAQTYTKLPVTETLPAKNLNQLYKIKQQLANPAFSTAEPTAPETPKPAQPRVHTALADLQRQRDKVQQLMNLKQEIETLTARAGRTRYGLTPGLAADIEDIYPNPQTEADMDAAIQGYEAQKKKLADYIARQRRVFPKEDVAENFADGKGPGRPGDSARHGIPQGATMAQLEKASHAKGRKGQLARWQLNMRRGKAKAK